MTDDIPYNTTRSEPGSIPDPIPDSAQNAIVSEARALFSTLFGRRDAAAFFAPGRVNLIGEYTDCNGGYVLPCALRLGTYAIAAPRRGGRVRLRSTAFIDRDPVECALRDISREGCPAWALYPLGVLKILRDNGFFPIPGFDGGASDTYDPGKYGLDILFHGDLPLGAGLSSSASIELLTAVIANEFFGLGLEPRTLALISRQAENAFAGMQCGIMDQFTVALGRSESAILLRCATLEYEYLPLPPDGTKNPEGVSLVVADSGTRRGLTESRYNERIAECESALAALCAKGPLQDLCVLTPRALEERRDALPDPLLWKRARHVVGENARVLEAAEALSRHDYERFGKLMNASHASLRDDFEVSTPELDFLAETAQNHPGVLGSRMTGAGFGGCTVNLVRQSALDSFIKDLEDRYTSRFGIIPHFFPVQSGPGAHRLGNRAGETPDGAPAASG